MQHGELSIPAPPGIPRNSTRGYSPALVPRGGGHESAASLARNECLGAPVTPAAPSKDQGAASHSAHSQQTELGGAAGNKVICGGQRSPAPR